MLSRVFLVAVFFVTSCSSGGQSVSPKNRPVATPAAASLTPTPKTPPQPKQSVWRYLPSKVFSIVAFDVRQSVRHHLFGGDVMMALSKLQSDFDPKELNLLGDLITCKIDLSTQLTEFAFGEQNVDDEEESRWVFVMAGFPRVDVESCLATLAEDFESTGDLLRHSDDWYVWLDEQTVLFGAGGSTGQGGLGKAVATNLLRASEQVRSNEQLVRAFESLDAGSTARYLSIGKNGSAAVRAEIHLGSEVTGWVRSNLSGFPERVDYWLKSGLGRPFVEGETVVWQVEHLSSDVERYELLRSLVKTLL